MNDKCTEIDGKFYQEVSVVMLPTNQKSRLSLRVSGELSITDALYSPEVMKDRWTNQHLYFLSDEEIKEDAFVVSTFDKWSGNNKDLLPQLGKILKIDDEGYLIDAFDGDTDNRWCKGHSKKIIATTDKNLGFEEATKNYEVGSSGFINFQQNGVLPRPSNSFIEKFVSEWNKGNKIDKVLVQIDVVPVISDEEYDKVENDKMSYKDTNPFNIQIIKVAPDNTITIKPLVVKDSWNREELKNLLYSIYWEGWGNGKLDFNTALPYYQKWINENL